MRLTYLGFLFFILVSCDDSFEADPVDPRLPSYSEIGKNEAGAFINGNPWVARIINTFYGEQGGFLKLRVNDSTHTTYLSISGGYFGYNNDPGVVGTTSIVFKLADYSPKTLNELQTIGAKSFSLDGAINYGSLILQYEDSLQHGRGNLYIRNVSKIEDELIYSGTFGFEIQTDSSTITVYQGRFDYTLDAGDIQLIQ